MQTQRNSLEVAWAAGLFEGEGYWAVRRYPRRYGFDVGVAARLASTDRDVVERFQAVVGFGSIAERSPRNPRARQQYHWESGSREDLKRMASAFLPYLGERRRERALEILAVPPPKPQKDRDTGRRYASAA